MTAIKLAPLSAVLLSQFVAADAGSQEAQHDARLCAVYGAYLNAFKSGNKTQLMLVQSACETYATPKACRALTDTPDRASAAASRACKVYGAYKLALDACGIPALMKGASAEQVEAAATAIAGEFVGIVSAALYVDPKPGKSKEERAADKAAKEAEAAKLAKQAERQHKAAVQAEAQQIAAANALTLDDMVRSVVSAMRTGALSEEQLQQLDAALDAVAVIVETVAVPVGAVAEPAHA